MQLSKPAAPYVLSLKMCNCALWLLCEWHHQVAESGLCHHAMQHVADWWRLCCACMMAGAHCDQLPCHPRRIQH